MALVNSIGGISVIIAVLAFLLSVFNFIHTGDMLAFH
jgi:hypothetical protein